MSAKTKAAPLPRTCLATAWSWCGLPPHLSVWELHGQSLELLAKGPLPLQRWATAVVLAGAAVDAVIGLWLAWRPSRMAYATALAVMIGMTLAATAIDPAGGCTPWAR